MVSENVETISILVLTEDSGEDGFETIAALVSAMLLKVESRVQLDFIEIEPTKEASALCSLREHRDQARGRWVRLVPCRRLCREKHSGKDVDVFEGWAANRAKLDEEIKPKEMVCLRAKHNRELATTGFPFDLAHELKKSLKAAVDELSNSHDLRQALRRLSAA